MNNYHIWCDFVERDFLKNEFKNLLDKHYFNGATSNPSIFSNAILNSQAYKDDINKLKHLSPKEIYENLAIEDIKIAADTLLPLYEKDKDTGYISLEIDPAFSNDARKSIEEGKRLFKLINKPNLMIKVPATNAGFEVMNELYKNGININATLIFSPQQAKKCAEALNNANNKENRAVISIFVSRFDSLINNETNIESSPRLGILNAKLCALEIKEFNNPLIRALFASTGAKSASLKKDYYLTALESNAINTAPLEAIKTYRESKSSLDSSFPNTKDEIINEIKKINLNNQTLESISEKLLNDGLKAFEVAFSNMLSNLK